MTAFCEVGWGGEQREAGADGVLEAGTRPSASFSLSPVIAVTCSKML
jgi:hypothetical protein